MAPGGGKMIGRRPKTNRRRNQPRFKGMDKVRSLLTSLRSLMPSVMLFLVMAAIPWLSLHTWDYLTHCSFFRVETVVVDGNKHLSSEQIKEIIASTDSENVLRLSSGEIEDALHKTGWVRHAEVSRVLPRTVKVRVVEFEPVATLITNKAGLVDDTGTVFRVLQPGDPVARPVITGLGDPGADLLQGELLARALTLSDLYRRAGMAEFDPLAVIHHHSARGFALVTENHRVIAYLGHEDFAERIRRVRFVIDDALRRGLGVPGEIHCDLREDRVVVLPPKSLALAPNRGAALVMASIPIHQD